MFEELELVDDAAHRDGIRRPVERFGEHPGVAIPDETEGAPGSGAGDLERADVGGLGPEHAPAGLERGGLGAPATLELEDEKEQRDVQEYQYERDFGAHGGRWLAYTRLVQYTIKPSSNAAPGRASSKV